MKKKKLDKNKLITFIFVTSIGFVLLFSLLSYSPSDPVGLFGDYQDIKPRNLFSNVGATIAAPIFETTFGYGSLCLPIILLFMVYARIKSFGFLKSFEISIKLLISGLWVGIILALPQAFETGGSFKEFYPSGAFSALLTRSVLIYTGNFGAIFIFSIAFLLSLVWILHDVAFFIDWLEKLQKLILFMTEPFIILSKKIRAFFTKRKISRSFDGHKDVTLEQIEPSYEIHTAFQEELRGSDFIDSQEVSQKKTLVEEVEYDEEEIGDDLPDEEIKEDIIETFPRKRDGSQNKQGNSNDDWMLLKRVNQDNSVQESDNLDFEVEGQHVEKELKIDKFIEGQLKKYEFPSIELLDYNEMNEKRVTREELEYNARLLIETLSHFNVSARIVKVMEGPVVTQFQIKPEQGVKISRIVSLQDDLALALKAKGIRIIAPIPGKAAVGVEIPNRNRSIVYLKNIIRSEKFVNFEGNLPVTLGKMINGEIFCDDLAEMPHLLLAGATGTGKSVGLNVLIASLLYRIPPSDVKFILIDPKRLEFSLYEELKNHYLAYCPELDEFVITEPDNAVLMFQSLIIEMEKRYQMLKELGVRSVAEYNNKIKTGLDPNIKYVYDHHHLPYLVVIIDELADLMLSSAKEVEEPIARLTQKARAAGIHLIVATQRPSVNVITGTIKANFPVRVAYQVPQKIDSKVILDLMGADQLIGKGDMLFKSPAFPKPVRIQTPLIETHEVEKIVKHIKKQPHFPPYQLQLPAKEDNYSAAFKNSEFIDPLFNEAKQIVILHQVGSASLLQRKLRIGYARAASILDQLEEAGVVGPSMGSKAREVFFKSLDDI